MKVGDQVVFQVSNKADVLVVLMQVRELGFIKQYPELMSQILTVVSELASNIVKYANRGSLRLGSEKRSDGYWVEIVAQDEGPGISNYALALEDHYSTSGSLGLGLPGVRRMVDEFLISSPEQGGTLIRVAKRVPHQWPQPLPRGSNNRVCTGTFAEITGCEIAWAVQPISGRLVSGDAVAVLQVNDLLVLVLIDATGHGDRAHSVAELAMECVRNEVMLESKPVVLLSKLHDVLASTWGAAVSVLSVDAKTGEMEYSGVGNTRAFRCVGAHWSPISRDGVVGSRLPSMAPQINQLKSDDIILLWTDGLPEHASPRFVERNCRDSALWIAENLVKQLSKPNDDAACIVMKWSK
jgi:anti-sigma regulatory factor (Ser/Thr protein kinase)